MNKKILLTLILALVLSISCFASVVNAADALNATVTTKNESNGNITVTIQPNQVIRTGFLDLTYSKDAVKCITDNVTSGEVQIKNNDGYVTIGFKQNTTANPVTLTFAPVSDEAIGKNATFTLNTRDGDDYTLADGTIIDASNVKLEKNEATVKVQNSVPTPTEELDPTPTPTPTDEPTLEPTNEATPTLTPAQTGDGTAAEGPMPQTGVNVLAVSVIVLATVAAGYIARKKLVK